MNEIFYVQCICVQSIYTHIKSSRLLRFKMLQSIYFNHESFASSMLFFARVIVPVRDTGIILLQCKYVRLPVQSERYAD